MKKILYLLLVFIMLTITACSSKETSKTEEHKEEVKQEEMKTEQQEKEKKVESQDVEVNEKLKDINAIKEFLKNDENFGFYYHEVSGEPMNFDNSKLCYFDFTDDEEADTAIITWTKDNDFRPVIFITLEDGEYKYILTDLRATKDSELYFEDGFIIEEKNDYHRLAYNRENEFIVFTGASFSEGSTEYKEEYNPLTKYSETQKITKIDGYRDFVSEISYTYYDENNNAHSYSHVKYNNKFNANDFKHEQIQEILVEEDLSKIILDNYIIGNDSSLYTFANVLAESNSLEKTIDYYLDNRQKFTKETRLTYIDDFFEYTGSFKSNSTGMSEFDYMLPTESIKDGSIVNVKFEMENPIPENAQNVFKLVKRFYIEDGENMTDLNFDEGDYDVACVNDEITRKMRMMKFDKEVLSGEGANAGYISREDEYVDIIFDTKENVFNKAEEIVYPTILVENLSQANELKHRSIWKASVVIVPENVEFVASPEGNEITANVVYLTDLKEGDIVNGFIIKDINKNADADICFTLSGTKTVKPDSIGFRVDDFDYRMTFNMYSTPSFNEMDTIIKWKGSDNNTHQLDFGAKEMEITFINQDKFKDHPRFNEITDEYVQSKLKIKDIKVIAYKSEIKLTCEFLEVEAITSNE